MGLLIRGTLLGPRRVFPENWFSRQVFALLFFSFSFFQIEISTVMESNLGDLRHGGIPGVYNGPFISGTDIGHDIPPSRKLRYAIRSSCKRSTVFNGQLLGVPDREARDELLGSLPSYFESKRIHIAGLITASYSGEDYSHYLAKSSLGTWLKEQGVPAIYGVDTRALTKKIRTQGSMLGKLLLQKNSSVGKMLSNGLSSLVGATSLTDHDWRQDFEFQEWVDPNAKNLVAEGQ